MLFVLDTMAVNASDFRFPSKSLKAPQGSPASITTGAARY